MLSFICILCSLNIILCFNYKSNIHTLPDYEIPSWVYNGHKIWGLTAMITADLLNTCFDADIPSDLDIIREQYDR